MRLQNDSNAAPIVEELRKDGGIFDFWVPSARQKGLPDGVYFFAGLVAFVEIKTLSGKLTPEQIAWRDQHVCIYRVVRSVAEAKQMKADMVRAAELAAGLE